MNGYSNHRPRRQRPLHSGFTLMEVLLVLVILVVLASMAVTVFSGTQDRADKQAAAGQVGILKGAIDMYRFHTRSYPDDLNGLVSKPTDSRLAEHWSGPYLDKMPKDPWDNDYRFAAPGKHNSDTFDVWSTGPDSQDGSDDDIGNWET
ncbi:MAG: type II secretion system major pseudopilin GspG [Pirellulales bacterium]